MTEIKQDIVRDLMRVAYAWADEPVCPVSGRSGALEIAIRDALRAGKSQPVEQKKCGNTSCAKTDANGGVHDCWYPDCLTEAKPTPTTTAAVLPNGATASNVYEAYAEGLKAGAKPVEQGKPVRPMSDEEAKSIYRASGFSLNALVRRVEAFHGIRGATE